MEAIAVAFIIVGLALIVSHFLEAKAKKEQVVDKTVTIQQLHTLDVQFGNENRPSEIFADMFENDAPWVGGYTLGKNKTYSRT